MHTTCASDTEWGGCMREWEASRKSGLVAAMDHETLIGALRRLAPPSGGRCAGPVREDHSRAVRVQEYDGVCL